MKKVLPLICLLFCTVFGQLYGQNGVPCCTSPGIPVGCAEAGTSIGTACIICSLAGLYQGNNGPYGATGDFSCGIPHNSAFVSVIANSNGSIEATVLTSNCNTGEGLQLILFDAAGTEIDCFSVGGSPTANVSASGLVPGALYTFQIDGFNGDACDFTIIVTGADTGIIPDPPGEIRMDPDTILCPGAEVCFEIDPIAGASFYEWELPNNIRITSGGGPNDLFVCGIVETTGGGAVRVSGSNFCFNGIPGILPVIAIPITPAIWPPIFVCTVDMPWDTIVKGRNYIFSDYGGHDIIIKTALGCDSLIKFTLIPKVQIPGIVDTTICEGDCVMVGLDCYDEEGSQRIVLTDPRFQQANGCDSTVTLIIQKLNPEANVAEPDDLPCMMGATVALDGTSSSSGSSISYEWIATNGGTFASSTNTNAAAAASPGTYILIVTDTNMDGSLSCIDQDTVMVEQQVQVLNDPVFSDATTNSCLGETYTYTIGVVSGAVDYVWTIPPGATMTGGLTSIMVTFPPGAMNGNVCVKAIGTCGESMEVCIPVTINPVPTADFTASTPICITGTSTILYTGNASGFGTFTWNFNGGTPAAVTGPGPHNITWSSPGTKTISLSVEENGCNSPQGTQTVQVDSELATPVISCVPTQTSVTFNWGAIAGATDYTVTVNGVATTQTGTSFPVTGLSPGDDVTITVVANSASACPSTTVTEMCTAQDCPTVTLSIPPVAAICRDASTSSITLTATQMGGAGGGGFVWSGPGTSANGLFDPSAASVGTNTVSVQYTEGTCSYTESINIDVNDVPDPSFTVSSPICETETSTVTYTGSASAAANYTWGFGAGSTVVSGSGVGPYEVQWAAGNHTVSLTVSENGCTSPESTQPVVVDPELQDPVISCGNSTTTSVSFTWDAVPGATTYQVNGPGGEIVDLTARTVEVNGVAQGANVTIEIIAISGNSCPNSSATFTCTASNCPPETINPDVIGPFCDDGTGTPIVLTATSTATGTYEWSGPGVTNNMFDPNAPAVNAGDLTLTVKLSEGICEWTENLVVTIFDKPNSPFVVDDPICVDDVSNIAYTGSADAANATFNWGFDGGTGGNVSAAGPHAVGWATGGAKNITLTVTENNCVSDETTAIVNVEEPLVPTLIKCTSDQDEIFFSWDFVPNALNYTVSVISAPASAVGVSPTQNEYNVSGLMPGDMVSIEVLVEGITSCGPITLAGDCIAQNCPDYVVNWPTYVPICGYPGTGSFRLDTVTGFEITNLDNGNIITDSVRLRWSTGDPATNYLTGGGVFSPLQSIIEFGEGEIPVLVEIEYPIGSGCFQTVSSTVPVRQIVDFGFYLDQEVCETESLDLTLDSLAYSDPAATYTWDFGRANANPGGVNEIGPHVLTWNEGGIMDVISLTVTTPDNCELGDLNVDVRIDSTLNALAANLSCNAANTGNQMIEFIWNDNIPGVTNYDISVLTPGFTITSQTGSSAFFGGLTPGDEIELQLEISDSSSQCPPVSTSITCLAKQCDPVAITFEPILDNCLNATGTTTIQLQEILTPDPSSGGGTRVWSGGPHISSTGEFTVDAQGNYPVAFEFEFDGCTYNGNTSFTMIETPIADFALDNVICEDDAATITNNSIAHPDAVFSWDFDNGTPTSTDPRDPESVSWATDGMNTISLSIDNDGCTDGPVLQSVQVDPALGAINPVCTGATTTGITVSWDSDPNVTEYDVTVFYPVGTAAQIQPRQTGTTFSFNGVPVGSMQDMVEILITPITNSSCPAVAESVICQALGCPTITLDFTQIGPYCVDDQTMAPIVATTVGDDGSGTLAFTGPGVMNGEFSPNAAGVGTHTITFTYSERGCDYTWTEEIVVNDLPSVNAGSDMILSCNDLSVDLTGNDLTGALYSWTDMDGTVIGTTPNLTVADGGTYTFQITDTNGCIDTDELFVDASFSDPALDFDLDNISCFGRNDGTISINGLEPGIPPFEYSFNGSPFSPTNTFYSNLGEDTYTIIGRDANGCEVTETITIIEPDELSVEILISGGENPVPFGDSIELTANTNYDPADLTAITWSPADQFPICEPGQLDNCISLWVTPTGQTVYTVTVEAGPGCSDEDNINIVGIKDHPIFIPSGFSPGDGDGNNDFFGVFGDPEVISEVKSFLIFDRWGEVIFENYNFPPAVDKTIDPVNGWDGTFRGQPLNSGVYIYMVEVEFFDGLVEIFKGDVTIK